MNCVKEGRERKTERRKQHTARRGRHRHPAITMHYLVPGGRLVYTFANARLPNKPGVDAPSQDGRAVPSFLYACSPHHLPPKHLFSWLPAFAILSPLMVHSAYCLMLCFVLSARLPATTYLADAWRKGRLLDALFAATRLGASAFSHRYLSPATLLATHAVSPSIASSPRQNARCRLAAHGVPVPPALKNTATTYPGVGSSGAFLLTPGRDENCSKLPAGICVGGNASLPPIHDIAGTLNSLRTADQFQQQMLTPPASLAALSFWTPWRPRFTDRLLFLPATKWDGNSAAPTWDHSCVTFGLHCDGLPARHRACLATASRGTGLL